MTDKQKEIVAKIVAGRPDVEFTLGAKGKEVTMNGNGALPWPEITVGPQGGVKIWVRSYNESEKTALEWALEADQLLAKQIARDARKAGIGENREHRQKRAPAAPAHHASGDALEARDRLAAVLRDLACLPECKKKIEELKKDSRYLDEPDFVWRSLVESSSSWGNSRGYGGLFVGNPRNYDRITFDTLSGLSPLDRFRMLLETLSASKVRMSKKKAGFLAENFEMIEAMGGLAAAKAKLLGQPTREAMMVFLEQFMGVGAKYSRNILMNVYHPLFHESVAVDDRIKSISQELGLSFRPYPEGEQFYLAVAQMAGLSGWEVNKLLYNFKDEVIASLRQDQPKSLKYV